MRTAIAVAFGFALFASPAAAQHEGHGEHAEHQGPEMPAPDPHAGHAEHAAAADDAGHHGHHNMVLDAAGMVMNHNPSELPRDCPELAGEVDLVVRAGREFASATPGLAYGYDQHIWSVPPCTKVNVTLENRDAVRHQWMVHGLPRYLYPMGMFTLEVNGPGSRSASFIVPSAAKTYLAHCDVAHHMEKGMKGQLVVGGGDGTLPSIPGVSAPLYADRPETTWTSRAIAIAVLAVGLGLAASFALRRS